MFLLVAGGASALRQFSGQPLRSARGLVLPAVFFDAPFCGAWPVFVLLAVHVSRPFEMQGLGLTNCFLKPLAARFGWRLFACAFLLFAFWGVGTVPSSLGSTFF